MPAQDLTSVIEEYLESRAIGGYAEATRRNDRKTLHKLVEIVGNFQVRSLTARHMDAFFAERGRTCGPGTLNCDISALKAFFAWCRTRRYLGQHDDPLSGRRWLKVPPKKRLFVPVHDFGRLLDLADHPIDRMVVATGLYLFTRQSESGGIRVGDVDLDRGEVSVIIQKTNQRDDMPICQEYDAELRRWLAAYPSMVQQWSKDWYLHPSKTPPPYNRQLRHFSYADANPQLLIRPNRRISRIYDVINRVLVRAGYPADGEGEGGHTLRRSGALALYNSLADRGHDNSIRIVSTMLHHSTITTTEKYLDIALDRVQRDKIIGGNLMFTQATGNVTPLRAVDAV